MFTQVGMMRTSSAKAKGRRCSQAVADLLLEHAKHLTERDVLVTSSGETGVDVKLSAAAFEQYPLNIEAKNVEKLNIWQALEQAESHEGGGVPVVFFKRNRSKLYVALDASFFVNLLQEFYADGENKFVPVQRSGE